MIIKHLPSFLKKGSTLASPDNTFKFGVKVKWGGGSIAFEDSLLKSKKSEDILNTTFFVTKSGFY